MRRSQNFVEFVKSHLLSYFLILKPRRRTCGSCINSAVWTSSQLEIASVNNMKRSCKQSRKKRCLIEASTPPSIIESRNRMRMHRRFSLVTLPFALTAFSHFAFISHFILSLCVSLLSFGRLVKYNFKKDTFIHKEQLTNHLS